MPLYSLIALFLSVFGATYTAISALRNHYQGQIALVYDNAEAQLDGIKRLAGDPNGSAVKLHTAVKFWVGVWKLSHLTPILLFAVFAFGMGSYAVYHWNAVTAPASEEFHVDRSWRWVLAAIVMLNGLCCSGAVWSGFKVRSCGEHLTDIQKACEGTKAKDVITRGDVSAVQHKP